ncbi:MAG TPA: glycosyltransferase [Chitinophagales bacterium]|nr:glycosyltransferase [Chitinophagales bacterium]
MKRIILTVTNDLTYDQRMQKICRSLAKAGYGVELIGRVRDFSVPLKEEPYRQKRLFCLFNKGKIFYIEYNLRLLLYLLFAKFDAVCAIDLDTIAPVYLAGKLKGAKLVYDAHEYFTEVPEVVNRPDVKKVWEWVEKTFVPKFNLVYTVSQGLANLFSEKYKVPVEVIMNVPVSRQTTNEQLVTNNERYILYQGALNEGRGLEFLIEAMQEIDCPLKLAGEGDLSGRLRQLTQELSLEEKVVFLGYVEPAQLREITAGATIGINLLENKGLSYYYSLSNKFFDYIHARVPQVCIDFPEYRALNERYNVALAVKDCQPNAIKAAIERLLSDHTLYTLLQKNCDVCSVVLNWQEEEKKLLALYERLFR